jgi:hypothetical protein
MKRASRSIIGQFSKFLGASENHTGWNETKRRHGLFQIANIVRGHGF